MSGGEGRPEEADGSWLGRRERGTIGVIRFTGWLASFLGRGPMRIAVAAIAAWYCLFDREVVSASRSWLSRVLDRPIRRRDVFRHVETFAQVTLDRLYFARGEIHRFAITRTGNEHLDALTRAGRGAILLGAHLGSFEAMRAAGEDERFPITIVGHFENAAMITTLLRELDPDFDGRVLHAGRDSLKLALELRDAVGRGELIALLGDRVGLNEKEVRVPFFGAPARFPTGPMLLASILRAPIYLVFALYHPPNRYSLHCEPFAESVELPRGRRQEALEELVSRYARRLEEHCVSAPCNWFNFYDFWEEGAR